jgi:MFS transporter, MHS family, proline/betaine transporter
VSLFSSLRRDQKEAIGLLQIGTFLEYFDLMIYVHMAVLLNDLFFPKTDPHTASLIAAFALCSTYVLRPFGALLFGYIGDHIGRKTTVIITTMMMAISCLVMANLPTYEQIGITAAWIVTICRLLQGLSSMGEIVGAQVYLTEITKPPERYPLVATLSISTVLGSSAALGLASLVTSHGFNWRLAFWAGACIALVGSVARTRLRETPEFVDMKKRMTRAIEDSSRDGLGKAADLLKSTNPLFQEKINWHTFTACFFILCGWPLAFFFSYIHCGIILKNQFGYTADQIIYQNFKVSLFQIFSWSLVTVLCKWVNPLKIAKIRSFVFYAIVIFLPFLMTNAQSGQDIFFLQSLIVMFGLIDIPIVPILISYFPVFRRFTCESFAYALSRALVYIFTSFGLVYFTNAFNHYGLWFPMIPISLMYLWGLNHFEKLEEEFREKLPAPQHPDFFKLG